MKRSERKRRQLEKLHRYLSVVTTLSMVLSLLPSQGIAWARDQIVPTQTYEASNSAAASLQGGDSTDTVVEAPQQESTAQVEDSAPAQDAYPDSSYTVQEVDTTYDATEPDQPQPVESEDIASDVQDPVGYGNAKVYLQLVMDQPGFETKPYSVTVQNDQGLYLTDKGEWTTILWPDGTKESDKDLIMPDSVKFLVSQAGELNVWNLPEGYYTIAEVLDDTVTIEGYDFDLASSTVRDTTVLVQRDRDTEVRLTNVYQPQPVVEPEPEPVVEEPVEPVPAPEQEPVVEPVVDEQPAPQVVEEQTVPETDEQVVTDEQEAPAADEQTVEETPAETEVAPDEEPATDETEKADDAEAQADTPQAPAEDADKTEEEAAKSEEKAPEANTQKVFIYEGLDVSVTAELTDPSVLPAGVSFVVNPVSDAGAYIDAMNGTVDGDNPYNDHNTLLYDVSFVTTDENGNQTEVEPAEGTVKVSFKFKNNQLVDELGAKKASKVDVAHLPETDGDIAVEAVDAKGKGADLIQMTVDSFSVYAFSYTVDFTYDGYTYSIAGESDIMLSKLLGILGIKESIENVQSVTFSNPELVAVEQVEGDWKLTSLKPFTSNETLTVKLYNGAKYVIDVTDAQTNIQVTFYESDGTTVDTSASLDAKYYIAVRDWQGLHALEKINPVNGVATLSLGDVNGERTLLKYTGSDELTREYANSRWDYDSGQKLSKPSDFGTYSFEGPTQEGDLYSYRAVKKPAYEVEIVFDGETASDISNDYSVYAAINANNNNGQNLLYYSTQSINLNNLNSTTLVFSSFYRQNGNPENKSYGERSNDATIALVKGLQLGMNEAYGTIASGTQIKDGDVVNGFVVSVTKSTDKTTYTFSKAEAYHYRIQGTTSDPISFDPAYQDNWYLLSTLNKASGDTYYSVKKVDINGKTAVVGDIDAYYTADGDDMAAIQIGQETANNYNQGKTKSSVYQPGDTVTNQLVHVSNQAQNYKQIVTGDNNNREAFGDGSVANKYKVTTGVDEGVDTINLTPVAPLKIKTVFKDDNGDDVTGTLPSGYKLLIKMVRDGETYYALHTVDASSNPSAEAGPIVFHKYTESNGTGTLDSANSYYSGVEGETISTQVVTGATDLTVNLIQHKVAGTVFYNENTIGGTQSSDLTKDLYSTSSEIDKNGAAHVMTTTFKKQKDDGVDHEITTSFYKKHEADINNAELNLDANNMSTDAGAYFFRVRLYNNGKLVAYKIVPVSAEEAAAANNTGRFTQTIGAGEEFQLVDDKGVDIPGGKLHYDPTVYTSDVRFYEAETAGQLPANLSEVSAKGDDTIDGYDFWQNVYSEDKDGDTITKTKTDLALYSAYKKKYEVKIVIDPAATPKTADDIRLHVEAAHKTTFVDKLDISDIARGYDWQTKETSDGKFVITYLVEDQTTDPNTFHWTDRGQNPNTLSGNETFSLSLQQGANGKQSEGFPVVIGGEAYTVSYDTGMVEGTNKNTNDDTKVTTITHYVYLKKAEYEPALTPEEVLGDAHEFGVVADTYNQSGHSETNAAVKHYNNNSNFDIEGSSGQKYSDVPFYIGEIQNQVIFGQGHYADTYIYTPQSEIDKHRINQANATRYNVSVIPTDLKDITDYIDGMIDSVRQTSEAMLQKTTIKPSSAIIDTTAFPDNTTIYVDCSDIMGAIGGNNGLQITKKDGQTIVFNIPDSGSVKVGQFTVKTTRHPEGVSSATGESAKNRDAQHNLDVNETILEHIYFNMPNASYVEIDTAAGMFLAPNAATFKQTNGCGWIVCGGTVNSDSEWHFYRRGRHFDSTSGALQINKKLSDDAPEEAKNKPYKFYVREKQADNSYLYYYNAEPTGSNSLDPAVTSPDPIELTITGAGQYKLERIGFQTDTNGKIIPRQLEVVEVDGSGDISGYTLEVSIDKESAKVTGGMTSYVNVTNTYTKDEQEETGTIKVTKAVTPEGAATAAGSAEFPVTIKQGDKFLNASGKLVDTDPGLKVTAGGTLTIENVPLGTYAVAETGPADVKVEGYTYTSTGSTATGTAVLDEANETVTVAFTNNYTKDAVTTSVSGTKTWVNPQDATGADHPTTITVKLTGSDGSEIEKVVTPDATTGAWTADGLPGETADGDAITYTATEVVPTGWTNTGTGNDFVNVITGTTSVSGTKTWKDGDAEHTNNAAEVTLTLKQKSTKAGASETTLNVAPTWDGNTYTFGDLPKYDSEGYEYTYTVEEAEITGFKSEQNGTNFTNTRTGTTTLTGTKTWLDGGKTHNNASEVTLKLTRKSAKSGSADESYAYETSQLSWDENKFTFTGLPQYDADGYEYTYTVDEIEPTGYAKTVTGNDIVNKSTEKVSVKVNKVWNDGNNAAGKRPASVTVQLLANNVASGDAEELNEGNSWSKTWSGLDKYDANGEEITYTVSEVSIDDYTSETTKNAANDFTITNTYAPGKTSVTATKVWVDGDNAGSTRPASIQFQLKADGVATDAPVTVTADDNWSYTWPELEKENAGQPITYTVEEIGVTGEYEPSVDGHTITNTLTGTTTLSGTKTWKDGTNPHNNADDVTLKLTQKSAKAGSTAVDYTYTADQLKWTGDTYKFTDLPKYDAEGYAYTYEVSEEVSADFDSEQDGTNFTNTRVGTTSVTGTKTWANDPAGKPQHANATEVQLTLKRTSAAPDATEESVTANPSWEGDTYTFTNLPQFDENGYEYTYTVTEAPVTGYDTAQTDNNFTNTYLEGTATLAVAKQVVGGDDSSTEQFNFELAKAAGSTKSSDALGTTTASAAADGTATFGPISYTEAGTYYYTITEVPGNTDGMTYASAPVYAKVEVERDTTVGAEHSLKTTVTYGMTPDTCTNPSATITNSFGKNVVKVSKVAAGAGEELAGAHIQVLDKDGNVVDEWDSVLDDEATTDVNEAIHEVSGPTLKGNAEYTLRETVAPDGYAVTTDTKFFLNADGTIDASKTTATVSDEGVLLVEDDLTKVKISKVDIANGEEVEGAHIQIVYTDTETGQEKIFAEWDSSADGPREIEGLVTGVTYTLREAVAPDGYDVTTDTSFVLKADGKIDASKTTTAVSDEGVLLVEDAKPAIEKYVNKDVHSDLAAFDSTFTYDIMAFVTGDAAKVEVTDTLVNGIEFVSEEANVKVADLGIAVDHKANGSVSQDGTAINKATAAINGQKLTVTIDDVSTVKDLRNHWIKVTFEAKLNNASGKVSTWAEYEAAKQAIAENGAVISDEYASGHEGVDNTASYKVAVQTAGEDTPDDTSDDTFDEDRHERESNTVTVTPKTTDLKVTKKWTDSADTAITWPTGAEVEVELMQAKTGTPTATGQTKKLDANNQTATFTDLPVFEGVTYSITEAKVTGTNKGFLTTIEGNAKAGYTITNKLTKVTVSKTAVGGGDELPGATIQVIEKVTGADGAETDKVVEEWKSTSKPHEIEGLLTGHEYILRETVAPAGYSIATDIKFTLNEDGTVDAGDAVTEDGVILIEDALTTVYIAKSDVTGDKEVAGAHIQIVSVDDENRETVVEEWTSTDKPHQVTGLTTGVQYILRETVAPDGYATTTDTHFQLKADGTVDTENTTTNTKDIDGKEVLLVEDGPNVIKVSKVAAGAGEELAGAHIQVLDKDGNIVDEWDSVLDDAETPNVNEAIHEVSGPALKGNAEYTLRETVAPDGYAVTTDTTFFLNADGTIDASKTTATVSEEGVLLVEDDLTKVTISKTDITGENELPGAKLEILDAEGNPAKDNKGNELTWTSKVGEKWVIEGLKAGTYTLRETTAPDGYTIAADTTFTIAKNGEVTVAEGGTITNGVILVEDAPTKVTVSKKAVGGEDELPGATIRILDSNGDVVVLNEGTDAQEELEWTSGTAPKEITGLKVGEKYRLEETVAPDGYAIASTIEFTIDKDGKVTAGDKVVAGGVLLIEDALTKVTVSKRDIANGEEIAGAKIVVRDENNEVARDINGDQVMWTSEAGKSHVINGLKAGTYTLVEEVAPDGYTIASETTFTIAADGTVTTTGSKTEDGALLINDALTKVAISKVDVTSGEELAGAHIQILDQDGNIVKLNGANVEWDSVLDNDETPDVDESVHIVEGLKTGVTYKLHETVAPDGYTIAADTEFTIGTDGTVTSKGTKTDKGVLLVEDAQTVVKVSKVAAGAGTELPGATIQIIDSEGNVIEWVSQADDETTTDVNEAIHEVKGLKAGTYTLRETVAPDGYTVTTDTTFTLDENGNVTTTGSKNDKGVLLVEDSLTKIKVSKVETGAGEELPGATLQILAKNEETGELEVVTTATGEELEWISGTTAKEITGLKTGVEYTLRETGAPDGYTITSNTKFTIDEKGNVTGTGTVTTGEDGTPILVVEDAPTKVKVSKVDIADGDELPGAKLQVIELVKGEDDTVTEKVVERWTSGQNGETVHEITKLTAGVEYILRETVAPEGYGVTTDIKFKVDTDGKVYASGATVQDGVILVQDAKTHVSVSKVDIASKEEIKGATIQVIDAVTGKVAKLNGEELEWVSNGKPHVIEGLKANHNYILRETVAPDGYTIATDIEFSIDKYGKVTVGETVVEDGHILIEDAKTQVRVSKVEAGAGEEIEGATIQIIDSKGEVVEEWTSAVDDENTEENEGVHIIEGLKAGEEYTLRETVAPDGYTIATDTTFTVDETGKVTTTGSKTTDEKGNTVLLVEDALTEVTVSKKAVGGEDELPGATIQILQQKLDGDGQPVVGADGKPELEVAKTAAGETLEWVSTDTVKTIAGLKTGVEYTLRETVAPDGYTIASDITFTIDEDGNVTAGDKTVEGNALLIEDDLTKIKVSKVDATGGEEVEGAHIQIMAKNEETGELEVVEIDGKKVEWVSGTEPETITGLKTGVEYTLRETIAPDGYTIATDTQFTIAPDGSVTSTGGVTEDGILLVEDDLTEVYISKKAVDGEDELPGATIQILDKDGNIVLDKEGNEIEWVSGDEPAVIRGLKTGVTYTLKETVAPAGYTIASNIDFTIDEHGNVTAGDKEVEGGVILIEDALTEVSISKKAVDGEDELPGATIQILDKDGNVVVLNEGTAAEEKLEWKSGTEPKVVKGLTAGETYTLKETVAPDGYTIASTIDFTIDENGNVTAGKKEVEDGVLLIEDAPTKITVSKKAVGGEDELPGATLQVLDADGNVVEIDGQKVEWVSDDEAHEIVGLKTGVEYTLKETVAPDGYTIASTIKFTIDENGNVTAGGKEVENGEILVEDAKTKVTVSKKAVGGEDELPGATIQILDSNGDVVVLNKGTDAEEKLEWVSGDEPKTIEGLKAGEKYTLKETVAPEGYGIASTIEFKIDKDGKVTAGDKVVENGEILIEDAKTSVTVSKRDVTGGEDELPGAKIQILTVDEDGNEAPAKVNGKKVEWVSGDEPHTVEGLKADQSYILRETVAPDGYTIATDTTFTIDEYGKVTVTKGSTTEDGTILVNDALTRVTISKADIDDGAEIAGAQLQVLDEDGNVALDHSGKKVEWTSTDKPHVVRGLKTGVTYTLHEVLAPEGYTVATDTTFTIEADGTVTVISASSKDVEGETVLVVNDAITKIKVSKVETGAGEEIEGAHIQVIDKTGKIVEEWDSTDEAHEIRGLKTSHEYTLRETVAPDGYTITTDTTFTIARDGTVTSSGSKTVDDEGVTTLLVEDDKTIFTVSKTAIAGSAEIPGADLQIMDAEGKAVVTLLDGSEAKWTSGTKPHEVVGLKAGETYILRETVAPNGYTVATDITFTLDASGNVTVKGKQVESNQLLVEDALTQVKISKKDVAGGDELAGATLKVFRIDAGGIEVPIDSWTSGTAPHDIYGLWADAKYILRETVAPEGYAITTDIEFTLDKNGKVTTGATTTTDANGIDTILVEDAKTSMTVSKTDIASGEEVKGARIQVLDADTLEVVEIGGKKVEWVSNGKPHQIVGLETGVDYILRETVAPEGYTIATDIEFSINALGKVVVGDTVVTDNHVLVEDAKTQVRVSKVETGAGEEIEGATIQIIDSKGKVVEEWTSKVDDETTEENEGVHTIEGLKTGEEYTLRETVAPEGYTIATDTKFTIDEEGNVTSDGSVTEDGILLVEDDLTKVSISKTAVGGGKELAGATIQILDAEGNVVELDGEKLEWVSGSEPKTIKGLKTGVTYTLKETVAPDGYTIASTIKFSIAEDGTVTADDVVVENGEILIEDAKTKVSVSKVDATGGEEVEGAHIQILQQKLDDDGQPVIGEDGKPELEAVEIDGKKVEWVSGTEPYEIEGLKTGVEYTLRETVAPDGYTIATDTKFTIDENGDVESSGGMTTDENGDVVLLVEDDMTKVTISKVDIAGGKEIAGAKIRILDEDGKVAETVKGEKAEWTSTTEPHVIEGLLTGVEYTLEETTAPDGYTVTTATKFTINTDGTIKVGETTSSDGSILVEDAKTSIKVSKVDIADGEEVEGATIQIIDSTGKIVEEWVSGTEPHTIEGLKTGETYTLRETVAPEGYGIATDTTFSISETGTVTSSGSMTEDGILLVEDAKTSVSVSKTDIASGKEIDGATIQILDADGVVQDEWVSGENGAKVHTIEGLKAGATYTLRETVAPEGYTIATDIEFTIDEYGNVTTTGSMTTDEDGNTVILVEDAKTSISVSKVDTGAGEEVEGATIQIIDSEGNVVETWVSGTEPHTIEGLKTGEEYTLRETVAPDGYTIATDTKFTIDENGDVTSSGSVTEDGILLVEDDMTKVTISKTDIASGEEIEGAKIEILDADGNVATTIKGEKAAWTSTTEPHVIEGLLTGVEYTLRETVAPDGYTVTTATKFIINTDGTVTVGETTSEDGSILVEDAKTSVKVSKVDIADGEEVAGARIQLLDEDGNVVELNGKKVEWTSGSKPKTIEGLSTGVTYTLREIVAPEGYAITTDITFSISETGTVTASGNMTDDGIILIEDKRLTADTATIELTKKVTENIPWDADEDFEFTLAPEGGEAIQKITLKKGETKSFDKLTVDRPGTTFYTITETKGKTAHVTYDAEPKWAKVVGVADPDNGTIVATVKYGTSKSTCTEDSLTIVNSYAAPALEKYINKDVHQDLPAFDTPFVYDILAFVPNDANTVVITDPLVRGIRFLNGRNTKVTVQDIGPENDHTAHGTVETAEGRDLQATSEINGKTLKVTIPNALSQGIRGHWVRLTYDVILDNEVVGIENEYMTNDEEVTDNRTVISDAYPSYHDGVMTNASYVVYADNGNYALEANDITVTPPTETFTVAKKWLDANGNELAWPEGAKVTVELLANGKPLDQVTSEVLGEGRSLEKMVITLSADHPDGTFTNVPIYDALTYSVVETGADGVEDNFTTAYTGNNDEGFTVTNTFEKEDEKTTKPTDETTKPTSDSKKTSADNSSSGSGKSSGTTSGTSTTGSSGGTGTSSAKLAKTGDPAAATSALMLGLAGIGSALAAGGVAIRNRRREDEDDAC